MRAACARARGGCALRAGLVRRMAAADALLRLRERAQPLETPGKAQAEIPETPGKAQAESAAKIPETPEN